ncbi:SusD/RagB family nutrient-binding outer membrane lipoprotein [Chitinophaga pendula]|uniref:RagB/SusD family nutrient uptake outer membrane protein n=1 Tax=Chitinophaga TaxID=79328 RepID=UPI000BAEE7FF|nr:MULTISPECIES: RagB/SusD family nutrient uptake outer membrane protein [Chitinophaga]ASZ09890.1 SusD/RagB family nutrient-binding outer membrane lipoprotein [Chitinophaga sp. MD30]UCJ07169.1 SusD/RagB family nutrient-binding outer membrane lipoprotein [Chitinophaga pendula]
MKLSFKTPIAIKSIAAALLPVLLLQVSCTKKFEQFNTNPNELTDSLLKYDYKYVGAFLPGMQTSIYSTVDWQYQLQQNLNADLYSGYMGIPTPFNSGKNNSNYFMMDWNNWSFKVAYDNVMSGWKEVKQRGEQLRPDLFAVATIIKVLAMHRVTDVYGPIPYSKFGTGGFSTSYDSQESIYNTFFQELDAAIAKLVEFDQTNPGGKEQLRPFDLVYNGDYAKWVRLANSLKLRLAMRMVYANRALAKTKAEEAVKHAYGVITDNSGNAFVKSGNGITVSNSLYVISQEYNDVRMGAAMESILGGYKDPRMAAYFRPTKAGTYKGIRNGIDIRSKEDYVGFSGLNIERATPIKLMTAAEVYFLRAEGALWGWDMKGSEKALYEQGISTSFDQYQLSNAATYIADKTSVPAAYADAVNTVNNTAAGTNITIAWDDAASFEVKQERILTQKWISVYPDGQEAWSEFRRTGYPKLWMNVVNYSGGSITGFIKRLPFPPDEYKNNRDEVTKATGLLGGADNGGTRLWWDKK